MEPVRGRRQLTQSWKIMFGKQMFAGPCRDNGTQRGVLTNGLCEVPPIYAASSYCVYLW